MEILTLSIGVGVLFGFFLWEKTGLQPGGWVVPGYIAFFYRILGCLWFWF
ncbi:hypothetical protein LEP1GSC173_2429 [Leptospira interrogans str. HAI1594]|uniref:Uncharacterized protein n=1 Tax=Leptospira interrogans serovar Grippotyphosa str. LT2186 TaxID=1001599 RepID=M3IAX0_LEPIR|nr:hypothetical protein LEP1GSC117_2766 [Leptospira interrogans serovar Icterohaemorrhagiae str. Verdun LP]EKP77921.1 hypothetical protein LEP1GSC173_2429 [Leptospira interrogans str. HAI1594]EMF73551.1 hypothetical protein LEP1GSC148_1220 [Leptospira interrogans serovar Canicola str. LT1962]EMG12531.1 hypothetical protein LEP1GSC151_2734 [Leptospira interrogans serovar Grippotyphosa str. LT2186]EMN72839.1 hypothetical protein LEP1GSC100_4343 [Leptospira interrogans serovar Bataviae str. UI 085